MRGLFLAEGSDISYPLIVPKNKSTETGPPHKEVKRDGLIISDAINTDKQTIMLGIHDRIHALPSLKLTIVLVSMSCLFYRDTTSIIWHEGIKPIQDGYRYTSEHIVVKLSAHV
jgi:hypothetical protein